MSSPSPVAPPGPRNEDLAQAVMTLARELWVVTDRLHVLERVLDARGLDVSEDVARFQPDAALSAELEAARERLLGEVLAALKAT